MPEFIRVQGDFKDIEIKDSELSGFDTFISVEKGATLSGVKVERVHAVSLEALREELSHKANLPSAMDVELLREALRALQESDKANMEDRVAVVKETRLWKTIAGFDTGLSIASSLASLAGPMLTMLLK